jgi:hypothetical protein
VVEPIPIEPRAVLVPVEPERAQQWLLRKVSPTEPDPVRARQYSDLMATGLWHPRDDQPIELKVSDNGYAMVADGQHRLAAVVIANRPVKLLIGSVEIELLSQHCEHNPTPLIALW